MMLQLTADNKKYLELLILQDIRTVFDDISCFDSSSEAAQWVSDVNSMCIKLNLDFTQILQDNVTIDEIIKLRRYIGEYKGL